MPYRKTVLATGEIYHIFNRGVAQLPIFLAKRDYLRFIDLINYYRFSSPPMSYSHFDRLPLEEQKECFEEIRRKHSQLVDIFAYCLMTNHFHLLLKQTYDNGISTMLSNLQNGYAKFFNIKNKRPGPLFQSMFKAIRIETDDQFLHVSRYIHLNPSTSFLVKTENLLDYPWSSFPEYLMTGTPMFVNTKGILNMVGGKEKYKKFVFDQAGYQKELAKIKSLCPDYPYP